MIPARFGKGLSVYAIILNVRTCIDGIDADQLA